MSKCGFPAFEATGANIDVTVLKQEGKGETEDVADNETISNDQVAIPGQSNGKITFNAGSGQSDTTCGKMRKLFVTITNIPVANTTRILQTTAPASLALTFSASTGDATSSASSLVYGALLALMTLAVMAF